MSENLEKTEAFRVYRVIDDREGMGDVVATYTNEDAANRHRGDLAKRDTVYDGRYFDVQEQLLSSEPLFVESEYIPENDEWENE